MALVSSANATKAEIFLLFNTLSGLVKNLEDYYTTVDLRNECCVTGKIKNVDGYMNIEMEDVVFYDMRGNEKKLETFYIHARNIRYVHMPKNKDGVQLLKEQLDSMSRKKGKTQRQFKTVRAERKMRETIQEAYKT